MADPTSSHFTPGEIKFLLAVLSNVEGGTIRAVADQLGMKDTVSVGARWNTIYRTKIKSGENANAGEAGGDTGKKRKQVKEENGDGAAAGAGTGEGKKKRAKKATAKANKDDDMEGLPRWDTPGEEEDGVKKENFD